MTPEDVACELRKLGLNVTTETIRQGIKQGKYPFGEFIQMKKPVFQIFRKKFIEWVEENFILGGN